LAGAHALMRGTDLVTPARVEGGTISKASAFSEKFAFSLATETLNGPFLLSPSAQEIDHTFVAPLSQLPALIPILDQKM